jgi:hypothetical protein
MINLFPKILAISVIVVAKEIFIFNEEILIVIAFSLFVYLLSTYGSTMISRDLDEKSITIQHKFDMYANIQEKTIIHLLNYHSKRIALTTKIKTVSEIKKLRMIVINQFYKANLNKNTLAQIEEMLNRFILNEQTNKVSFQLRYAKQLQNIKLKLTGNEK